MIIFQVIIGLFNFLFNLLLIFLDYSTSQIVIRDFFKFL